MGKSSWCKRFVEGLAGRGTEAFISHDDAAYAVCDRLNAELSGAPAVHRQSSTSSNSALPEGGFTYDNVWDDHREEIDALYEERAAEAMRTRSGPGVVILDSIYLRAAARAEAIALARREAGPCAKICCVAFDTRDEAAYARALSARSADRGNKKITVEFVTQTLLVGAAAPAEAEGFDLLVRCVAILEDGWREEREAASEAVLELVVGSGKEGEGDDASSKRRRLDA